MATQRSGIERRHDLDALRAFAMLLGIALHGALSFIPGVWPVEDSQRSDDLFGLLVSFIHGFRMQLFFLMSGFFTAMLWKRRGLGATFRQRVMRVLLPLLIAAVTVIPAMNVIIDAVSDPAAEASAAFGEAPADDPRSAQTAEWNVWVAAATGDLAMLDATLAAGADLNAPDPTFGVTPLAWAALEGRTDAADALLRRGADVEARNWDGSTALHSAAFMGRDGVAAALLRAGADPNARNDNGETPLDSAKASAEVTAFIAGLLQLTYDEEEVRRGREEASVLIAERGGESGTAGSLGAKADGEAAQGTGAEGDDYEFAAPWYWEFIYSDALAIGGESGEPFNLMHTPLFHHLWFLWFLVWLVALFAALAALWDTFRWRWPPLPARLVVSPWMFVWAFPLTAAAQWFMGVEGIVPEFGPDTATGLIPPPHILLYYAIFFGFGVLYFGRNEGGERITRGWPWMLALGLLLLLPGVIFTYGADDSGSGADRLLSVLVQAAYPWLMTLGLMGLFRALLREGSSVARYISDSAYWLYVTHLPLIILLQYAVAGWTLPAALKFAIVCAAATGALLLVYQFGVRYTPVGTLLNGKRTRPAKRAAAGG